MNPITLRELMYRALETDLQGPVAAAHAAAPTSDLLREYAQVISFVREWVRAIPAVPPVPEYAARLCPPPPPRLSTTDRVVAALRPYRPDPPVYADPPPRPGVSFAGIDAEVPAADIDPLMTRVPAAFWRGYRETLALLCGARADGSLARYHAACSRPPAAVPATSDPPTIWYHGIHSYSIDCVDQVAVSQTHHRLLTHFRNKQAALADR